eukprot:gene1794-6262_t
MTATSFDLGAYSYSAAQFAALAAMFPGRWALRRGDSVRQVPGRRRGITRRVPGRRRWVARRVRDAPGRLTRPRVGPAACSAYAAEVERGAAPRCDVVFVD